MTEKSAVRRRARKPREVALPFSVEDVGRIGEGRNEPEWLRQERYAAWELFEDLPMPSLKDEAWRRTDLRKMSASALTYQHRVISMERSDVPATDGHAAELLFRSGQPAAATRSETLVAHGVIAEPLIAASLEHEDLLRQYLGRLVSPGDGKFAALTAAMALDGMFVYVPAGVQVDKPIHSSVLLEGKDRACATRIVVVVGEGASATIVHEMASKAAENMLYSSTVELYVEDGGRLTFVEVQEFSSQTWNITHERARVGADASCDWIVAASGSRFTKNFLDLDLQGQGAEGRMSGFFIANEAQHLDLDTQQNHFAPNTTSDLLFKGALQDQSRTVWQGMIYVAPGAQKTDGYQANRNLLLSSQARADSIPGLEILADDVRCTHGSTAGQLDEEPIFYLMTRGLPRVEAERLVIHGFFAEVFKRIEIECIRNRFVNMIDGKL
ncbi:MAG: Fe-S cluster assembly protein SufD [Anaerolineales bacterium]|nr:Fe-S cluster assembly protein SufD [Anaerolineales bacterium]